MTDTNAMREALEWYAEQVAGCRKLGRIGDPARHALDNDGGERARNALALLATDRAAGVGEEAFAQAQADHWLDDMQTPSLDAKHVSLKAMALNCIRHGRALAASPPAPADASGEVDDAMLLRMANAERAIERPDLPPMTKLLALRPQYERYRAMARAVLAQEPRP